jgi:hypothetical protein
MVECGPRENEKSVKNIRIIYLSERRTDGGSESASNPMNSLVAVGFVFEDVPNCY